MVDRIWKDIYYLFTIKNVRFIIKNQWHSYSSESDFDLIKVGRSIRVDFHQVNFSIIGFKLVIYKRIKQ